MTTSQTTTTTPDDLPYTTTREPFSPLPEQMDLWGKDPEAPVPGTIDGYEDHLFSLSGDLVQASDLADALVPYAPEDLVPLLLAIEDQTERANRRLTEAGEALHSEHMENVGHRIEDVGAMVLQLESVASLALEVHSRCEDNTEMVAGVLCSASNAIEYVRKRLDFLVYEADLPTD
jgi:hypothetical protein